MYSSDRGSVSALIERGAGDYELVVTPSQTGEHQITVEFAGQSIVRTALVLAEVAAGWLSSKELRARKLRGPIRGTHGSVRHETSMQSA